MRHLTTVLLLYVAFGWPLMNSITRPNSIQEENLVDTSVVAFILKERISQLAAEEAALVPSEAALMPTIEKPILKLRLFESKPKKKYFVPIKGENFDGFGIGRRDLGGKSSAEIRAMMIDQGFPVEKAPSSLLRNIYLAYHYDGMLWYTHRMTGFPVSFIYSYLRHESIYSDGRESYLWFSARNIGGCKARPGQKFVYADDDCYDKDGRKIDCKFSYFETPKDGIDNWIRILNLPRYAKCKSGDDPIEICSCMKKAGYHTSNAWKARSKTMDNYWQLRKYFPKR